jgi:holin-like protein
MPAMLTSLTTLLGCQLAGEILVRLMDLPVPGPVLGLVIMLAALAVRGGAPDALRDTANGLLKHLSLLFVPAGVGIMLHFERIGAEWLALIGAVMLSTWATIAVSAVVFRIVARLVGAEATPEHD